ncbi:hypothetical protein AGOR_G00070070 [Albula goreensis]|uniref:IRF tryptophan pentad repeat domain-containing protein n=1 Tax=Albula goreensis TaxID=1534307 RepID=A0A8T3DS68_9TELE|nr:hypothetical protein AGOR_G00070070 [Albula goreensis]
MPVLRTRMRDWLEERIESNAIPGLVWLDKEGKTFCIPWKHASRHGWEMEKDACIFREWAIHTGKYIVGETAPDYRMWKANFRCALNSLPDIEEVKDGRVRKGCGANRIYRMLQKVSKKTVRKSRLKISKQQSRNKGDADGHEMCDVQDPCIKHQEQNTGNIESPDTQSPADEGAVDDFCLSFQVSPVPSPGFGDEARFIEMVQQSECQQSVLERTVLLEPQLLNDGSEEVELQPIDTMSFLSHVLDSDPHNLPPTDSPSQLSTAPTQP